MRLQLNHSWIGSKINQKFVDLTNDNTYKLNNEKEWKIDEKKKSYGFIGVKCFFIRIL